MKTFLNRLTLPFMICVFVNLIGLAYAKNYEGAVVGSVVGMLIAFLALEIKVKLD